MYRKDSDCYTYPYWGCVIAEDGSRQGAEVWDAEGRAFSMKGQDLILPRKVMVEITVPDDVTHVNPKTLDFAFVDEYTIENPNYIPIDEWIASLEGGE